MNASFSFASTAHVTPIVELSNSKGWEFESTGEEYCEWFVCGTEVTFDIKQAKAGWLHSFLSFLFLRPREKKHTRIVCRPAKAVIRSISCSLQLRLKSNQSKKKVVIKCWNGRSDIIIVLTHASMISCKKMQLSFKFWFIRTDTINSSTR